MHNPQDEFLRVERLKTYFPVYKGFLKRHVGDVKAVDGVSFALRRGETLGVVGESGCGKTSLGKTLMMLAPRTGGEITYNFDGQPRKVSQMTRQELFHLRENVSMVFQDPYSSLNPQKKIAAAFDEPMRVHGMRDPAKRRARMEELMALVNLDRRYLDRYPHEFSGGQRQRIAIARALCIDPKLVICDEPVSALDVSIQAQVLNLMRDIQRQMGLTYLFIAHDLSVVYHMSDRIAVMYLGRIVELAAPESLYRRPRHPYTEALLSAVPVARLHAGKKRIVLEGDVPSPINKPDGCAFCNRCRFCGPECREREPELVDCGDGHLVACHYPLQGNARNESPEGVLHG